MKCRHEWVPVQPTPEALSLIWVIPARKDAMGTEERTCPRCDAHMEEGWLLYTDYGTTNLPVRWVEGTPEPSFWAFCFSLFGGTHTKVGGKTLRAITSYRCVGCGYLESYATRKYNGWRLRRKHGAEE